MPLYQSESVTESSRSMRSSDASPPDADLEVPNVLFYKEHSAFATPIRGTLRLDAHNIFFECPGYDYCWNLRSIKVDKFKGRINSGIQIHGKRELSEDEKALKSLGEVSKAASNMGSYQDKGEYKFTHVSRDACEAIQEAVAEAKARAKGKANGKGKGKGRGSKSKVRSPEKARASAEDDDDDDEDEDEGQRENCCATLCAALATAFGGEAGAGRRVHAEDELTKPLSPQR